MSIAGDNRERWQRASLAGLLLVLIALVYVPSLGHLPRADQWGYLLNVTDQQSFGEIFAHTYSYNRTCVQGDSDLFRPLLFAVLAAEKAAFGNDFALVQATGICLHMVVALLLLSVLLHIAGQSETPRLAGLSLSTWLAYGIAVFFALNFAVQELVIWSHLHGYLVFAVLLLGSLRLLLQFVRNPDAALSQRRMLLFGSWLLALLSAFTYELGQFYAILAGLFVMAALRRQRPLKQRLIVFALFAVAPLLYQAVNHIDKYLHRDSFQGENLLPVICQNIFSTSTLVNSIRFFLYTVVQPFFPGMVESETTSRLVIPEPAWIWNAGWRGSPLQIASFASLGLFALLTMIGLRRLRSEENKLPRFVFLLACALFGAYMLMTVFGRMNLHPGTASLSSNSYYAYMALLFFLIGCFAVLTALIRVEIGNSLRSRAVGALLLGLIVLSATSALEVRAVNRDYAAGCRDLRRSISRLDRFVCEHRVESDFCFSFDRNSSDPSPVPFGASGPGWAPTPPLGEYYGVPLTAILFKRYLNDANPRYVVTMKNGRLEAKDRLSTGEQAACLPDQSTGQTPQRLGTKSTP